MRPHSARRPLAPPPILMPLVQGQRSFTELRHRLHGVEQIAILAIRAAEVLAPQLQPQVAGKPPSAIAESCWIDRFARVAFLIDHGARDLRIVTPGPPIEIVRSD